MIDNNNNKSSEKSIEEIIQNLESLVKAQSEALKVSKEIISLKNQMIAVCEKETDFYKRIGKRSFTITFWVSIMLIISLLFHIIKALA